MFYMNNKIFVKLVDITIGTCIAKLHEAQAPLVLLSQLTGMF